MKAKFHLPPVAMLLGLAGAAEVHAQLPNAWQINDNLTTSGFIQYQTNLPTAQVSSAMTNGWRYDLVTRMISDNGSAASQSMAFGDGTRRFYVFFDLNGFGELTAQLLGSPNVTYPIAAEDDATNYHTHELIYDPATSNATYRVDGAVIASWPGQVSAGQADQVMWGANASAGRGAMNYHRAQFEIVGEGVIASYDAGVAGNPAVAPSPTNQAWTRFTSGGALDESAVSPDSVALPPLVTTLAASGVQPTSATVNALLNPDGLATIYYFEYGATTNYGSFTITNTVPPGAFFTNASVVVPGLSLATTYHFRAVASNSITVAVGENMSFSTPDYAATLPATDVQANAATLNGLLNLDGLETVWYFEYGLDTNYGNFTPTNFVLAGGATLPASQVLAGLSALTTYHFRVVASNSTGIVTGTNQSFTTPQYWSLTPGTSRGGLAWGDFDRDQRLDILLTGIADSGRVAQVLRNTGSAFTNVNAGLPGIAGPVAWGDYDRDGWLDFILAGFDFGLNQYRTLVWRNTGDGFTNSNAGLPGVGASSVAWGDYDNDGRPDLLVTGTTNGLSERLTQIWRNTGSGFTNIQAGITPVYEGAAVWADFDNDGRLDILLTGETNSVIFGGYYALTCELWRNTGNGFTNDAAAGLATAKGRYLSIADYDNDGFLDFLIAGETRSPAFFAGQFEAVCDVWRNTGSGFSNVNAGLPPLAGRAVWGDYDNDGRPDVLLIGRTNTGFSDIIAQVWRNTGTGFTNFNAGLTPEESGSAAWGDYDHDGRLDVLLAGDAGNDDILQVWQNLQTATNSPPAAPSTLVSSVLNGQVQLSWNPATDAETPSTGLSYNLRVGTAPGAGDVVSPEAESDGFRLLPALGNAQLGTNAFLNLQPGTYYWSAQAVDAAFAGGAFAVEASFVVPLPVLGIVATNADVLISWQPPYPGWVLQETLSLAPTNWSNSISGATNPIVVPVSSPAKFYRLFRP